MGNKIMQETTPLVECSAFHRGMSVLEASLRNTEDSETIISGLLKGAAEFYGASRASVVEADWDLGIGVITYEWCKDGVSAQRDMLQCLPMEKFPRWRKALRANKPVVISDLQRLENVYPDEAAFFREYGVTTLLAAPFSKRINQGFIAVDDPTRYTDDPVFLFIASYAVVVELNEIKQQQSLLAATKASKYNPEDIHINFFGGMEIISSKGTLTGEDIKADQCYLLLAYLILNHKKNSTVDTLAEIICPYDELDSPYKVVNNIVYRLRRTLSVIGLDKLVIGKNGTFQINPNFNIHTDFDRFEDACIRLTRDDFSNEEEFLRWKKISDMDYHGEEKVDHLYYDGTLPLESLAEEVIAVPSAEEGYITEIDLSERHLLENLLLEGMGTKLTERQRTRLWLYCINGVTAAEIASFEGIAQQNVSKSIASAKKKLKKFLKNRV